MNIEFANENVIENSLKIKETQNLEKARRYIKVKRILDCILATIALIIYHQYI